MSLDLDLHEELFPQLLSAHTKKQKVGDHYIWESWEHNF